MIYYGQMETEAFAMTYVHFDADDLKKNALPAALGCVCFPVPLILCPKSRLGRFCANQGLVLLLAYIAVQLAFAVIGAVTGWIPLIGWVINDPLAVAYFVQRDLCTGFESYVQIETQGISIGQSVVDAMDFYRHIPNAVVLTDVDPSAFFRMFFSRLLHLDKEPDLIDLLVSR